MAIDIVINNFIDADADFDGFDEAGPLKKEFLWSTDVVQYDNRVRQANQINNSPMRRWWLNYKYLTETNRDKIIELFNRAAGQYQTFKLKDRWDYAATYSECSITAEAAQVEFQLIKTYYPGESQEWDENKTLIVPSATYTPTVKVDNVAKTEGVDFTLDDNTGIVDFTLMGAPGAGAVITADYQFYFKVAFQTDSWVDLMTHAGLWDGSQLAIVEVK